MRLRPPSATVLNAGGGITFMLDFAPLNKQSKLPKFQIYNPVWATFLPITHDKIKSVNWSAISNGQIVQSSSRLIILPQTLLSMILIDV